MLQPHSPPILEVKGLHKSFHGTEVLRDIHLSVNKGELVFLIGPSGSGKSTLLRCCNRLEEPTSGSIIVDGSDILAPRANLNAMRQRIGMVFQQFNLYPHMTAEQNVMLALRCVQKKSKDEARAIAQRELRRMGLKVGSDGKLHEIGPDGRHPGDNDDGPAVEWEGLHRRQFGD